MDTPTVTKIDPQYGSPAGSTLVTLNGTGFGTDTSAISIIVDGVECVVQTATGTAITCLTGARPSIPSSTNFSVSVSQNRATLTCAPFTYAYRWSDPDTWGGDIPPIAQDAVYVPKGMVLLVDQSTPNLKSIIVEGSIIFAD